VELGLDASTGSVAQLTGGPSRPVTEAEAKEAVDTRPAVVVADDLQWFDLGALECLIEAAEHLPILASRRPAPGDDTTADALDHLSDILARARPPERLGLWDLGTFASGVAALRAGSETRGGRAESSEIIEALHRATGGSPGLAADCVAAGWDGVGDPPPAPLVDAVMTRVRRTAPGGSQLAAAWAVLADHDHTTPVVRALPLLAAELDGDEAERALRSGGLVGDDDRLIPLVRASVLADLPAGQRARLHDRAAAALARIDPVAAADHLLAGAGELPDGATILGSAALAASLTDPDRAVGYVDRAGQLGLGAADCALLRALVSFHAGAPDVLAHLDEAVAAADGPLGSRAALLSYGADLRELRFADAASRRIGGDLAPPLEALASLLSGSLPDDPDSSAGSAALPDHPATPGDSAGGERPATPELTPLARVAATTVAGLNSLARGDAATAIGRLTAAADDFDRLRPSAPLGFTPHALGALAALQAGDPGAVEIFTEQAIDHDSGGPGERLTHQLLQAYGRLAGGDYAEALRLLRQHAPPDDDTGGSGTSALLPQRDRLLLAALEAAIARRSGDTGRLRASWRRTEAALIRPSASWLLGDVLTELLAAGARLDDTRRVDPVLAAVTHQTDRLPPTGPGPVAGWWLRLQVAVAADDADGVAEAARGMAEHQGGTEPGDERTRVRVDAAAAWRRVMARQVDESEVVSVAERLTAVGDGWEASRILGRAALDEDDPRAARRMLELARVSANERIEEARNQGLGALGLSEREAEVALLVAEGRTHKEIGAQLFISPKTVEHHVAKIRQKLGAGSRAELLAIVREATSPA
jgi:DNA-binding CsgD family transcriptional regulator